MIDKAVYEQRILAASPAQLVVINFEIIADALKDALNVGNNLDIPEEKDVFRLYINKAKSGLQQLIKALNFEVTISHTFYEIYLYVEKLLNKALFSLDAQAARDSLEIIDMLLFGWTDTAAKNQDAPKAAERPKVYAGLTYAKGGHEVEYVDEKANRGYMA